MESFGIHLQRKTLYEQFYQSKKIIENSSSKKRTPEDIVNMANAAGEQMKKILSISSADGSSLKNQYNRLFLSLMDRLKYIQEQEQQKAERS